MSSILSCIKSQAHAMSVASAPAAAVVPYTRRLHFMWIDFDNPDATEPPSNVPTFQREWAATHPEWPQTFWNLSRCRALFENSDDLRPYIFTVFDEPWEPMNSEQSFMRMYLSDICRAAILHECGGFYCDLSVRPFTTPTLDDFWADFPDRDTACCLEPSENSDNELLRREQLCLNSAIGARQPGSDRKFWLGLVDHICANKHTERKMYLHLRNPVTVTGPYVYREYTRARGVEPLHSSVFARRVGVERGLGLSKDYDPARHTSYCEKSWAHSSNWGSGLKPFYTRHPWTTACVAVAAAVLVILAVVTVVKRRR